MAFRIETVEMTPKIASELLRRNAENQRNIRSRKVDQYARDMADGNWPMTGDTIKVDTNGDLIDGQHRVAAVVQAGIMVTMLVAYDVSPDVMPVLDSGIARTFSDVLKMSGSSQRNVTGAIVRRIVQWERGNRMGTAASGTDIISHSELMERYLNDVPGFDSASQRASDVRRANLGTAGPVGTAFYLFSQIDHEAAHVFFDAYVSGANLVEGDPVLALRNRMVRVGRDERLMPAEVLALFCRAWNAWREKRSLASVPIVTGGRRLNNATFPVPK